MVPKSAKNQGVHNVNMECVQESWTSPSRELPAGSWWNETKSETTTTFVWTNCSGRTLFKSLFTVFLLPALWASQKAV